MKQYSPILLGIDGNVEIVIKNKNKAMERVVDMAALFQLGYMIEFPPPTGPLPLKKQFAESKVFSVDIKLLLLLL